MSLSVFSRTISSSWVSIVSDKAFTRSALLSALYLAQSTPRALVRLLSQDEMRKGSNDVYTLLLPSALSDTLKPFVGYLLDISSRFNKNGKKSVLWKSIIFLQLSTILLFLAGYTACLSSKSKIPPLYLSLLFSVSSLLMSAHDSAADGLAVSWLQSDRSGDQREAPLIGLGQYTGHKAGAALTGGILPLVLGKSYSEKNICAAVALVMTLVFAFTLHQYSDFSHSLEQIELTSGSHSNLNETLGYSTLNSSLDQSSSSTTTIFLSSIFNSSSFLLVMSMFLYKAADHGIDLVWSGILVKHGLSQKQIIKNQLLLNTFFSLIGASLGTFVSSAYSCVFSLAIFSFLRTIPVFCIHLFNKNLSFQNINFIRFHSALEGIIGSAVTGAMFSYLLLKSSSKGNSLSTTFYSALNTLIIIGMNVGEISFMLLDNLFGHSFVLALGVFVHCLFSVLIFANK